MIDSTAYRPRSDVRFRVIEGEAFVLCQEAGNILVLNEVGARILELCAAGSSVDAIAGRLRDEFELESGDDVETDVASFVEQLLGDGVLEPVAEGA